MNSEFTAMIKQEDGWWIGWVEEVPGVNAQERTREELIGSLREALREILDLNREDARRAMAGSYEEVTIAA